MYLDSPNRKRSFSSSRGYIQVWILAALAGLLVATSFGLLLTLNGDTEAAEPPEAELDEAADRVIREPRPRSAPTQPRRIAARRNAQEAVQRYWTLLAHIRQSQEPPPEAEQPNPPIPVTIEGEAHRAIAKPVEQTLQSMSPAISKCYQMRLRHKPHLRGKIFFSFTLVPDQFDEYGTIGKAHIADSKVRDFRLEACLLKALSSAEFPISYADADAALRERWYHYNFNLQPAG